MIKVCQECGEEFDASNGNARFCNKDHYRECVVCGEEFYVPKSKLGEKPPKLCCSKKCAVEKRKQTNQIKYGGNAPASSKAVRDKAKATTLDRYGVEYGSQSEQAKKKAKDTALKKYGVEHHTKRDSFKEHMQEMWADEEFKKTRVEQSKKAVREIYGVDNVFSIPEIREKAAKTYKEKTGYDSPLQNPECVKKRKETNLERYGVKAPLQNSEILEKSKKTNLERYGVENPMQNLAVQESAKATCIDRYGYDNVFKSPEIQAKIRGTLESRYGKYFYSQTSEWKSEVISDPSKLEELLKFKEDPKKFISETFKDSPTIKQLSESIGVSEQTCGQYIFSYECSDMIAYVYSYTELEILEFLKSLCLDTEIITNTKSVITPYELDIYLPEYNFAIEVNPTSTHNSSINTFSEDAKPIAPSYHKMKTDMCEEKGIFLFHIFGYEWTHRQDIIKSMIRNILKVNGTTIFARKCNIREVTSKEAMTFLDNNHRQGYVATPIRLGLYYDDELVSLMTFSHPRDTIGNVEHTELTYELVRFCSKCGVNVVGGASRLFKYFDKTYSPSKVISFSDRAHTRGSLYQTLGFKEVRRSSANYVWVQYNTDKSYHRTNAQKRNLKKFLKDDSIDLSKTEKQIMEEHNFVQVFDSGTITWEKE